MATINHKTYNEATETFKDFSVYDGKETLIFKVDGADQTVYASNIIGSGIIKTSDNGPLSGTAKYLSDGLGNNSALALSTTAIGIGTNSLFGKFNLADASNARLEITPVADGVSLEVLDSARANPLDFKVFANDITFNTKVSGSYSERMRIDSSGKVGIGTSGPTHLVQIYGASLPELRLGDASAQIQMYTNTTDGVFGTVGESPLVFRTNATERMRIDSSGNVGIGTSSPTRKLQVKGAVGQLYRQYFKI
jgi:hypothetical protein